MRRTEEEEELARRAALMDLVGPVPAVGLSLQSVKHKVNEWVYQ